MKKLIIIGIGSTFIGASLVFAAQQILPTRIEVAEKMYNRTTLELDLEIEELRTQELRVGFLRLQETEDFCTLASLKLAEKMPLYSKDSKERYQKDCLDLAMVK